MQVCRRIFGLVVFAEPIADLTPLFHWNTKQVFLQFVGEYSTVDNVRMLSGDAAGTNATLQPNNQIVIWDRIVRRKRDARVNIEGLKNKYAFKDIARKGFRCVYRCLSGNLLI